MTKHILFIYPHQLYNPSPLLSVDAHIYLIEDPLFFGDARYPAKFHKMKLAYHRATMKRYQNEVLHGHTSLYIDYADAGLYGEAPFALIAEQGATDLHIIDPTDWALEKRIRQYCQKYNLILHWLESPNFITSRAQIDAFWRNKKVDDYHQTKFYIWQRQRLGILLDDEGKPVGGRWTYDTENRQKLGKNVTVPAKPLSYENRYITEARAYVERHWAQNPGTMDDFIYPTNSDEAEDCLGRFLHHKLNHYGTYQDAITPDDAFLFHSLLSAPLNVGLLDVRMIIETILAYYAGHPDTRLESVEGFIRQVIGWREFMRAVYLREGVRQRTSNFFNQQASLDARWYDAGTGILPIDDTIRKVNRYAYAHHIERLMLLGNFMVLAEVHPDEVYRWFMEMFIDAYDWVMVPNVYGMSQYADGGLMTTKPYISSSNYVRKMSNYQKDDWAQIWDGMYWRFIARHRNFFEDNPRLAVMTSHLRRMSDEKFATHEDHANRFLKTMPHDQPSTPIP